MALHSFFPLEAGGDGYEWATLTIQAASAGLYGVVSSHDGIPYALRNIPSISVIPILIGSILMLTASLYESAVRSGAERIDDIDGCPSFRVTGDVVYFTTEK